MKNLRNLLALLVVTVALFSCENDEVMEDGQAEAQYDITNSADNGDQGGDEGERDG